MTIVIAMFFPRANPTKPRTKKPKAPKICDSPPDQRAAGREDQRRDGTCEDEGEEASFNELATKV